MDPRGSHAFLKQARANNWQRYLESLPKKPSTTQLERRTARGKTWDICILTASDETQASMMRRQLEWRSSQRLLPEATRFFVVADPEGQRIGSGGATLRILSALYRSRHDQDDTALPEDLAAVEQAADVTRRVLVIHSGGDSRRLPHCSAVGKLFARIPHTLPDGRASTIFDEMLINLSGIATSAPPGLLVLSGDVLLVFDHLQLSFQRQGVTGVSVAAPQELGLRHGVYVPTPEHQSVHAFLHKASAETLQQQQAIDKDGMVQIDTGLVWFDAATGTKLAKIASVPAIARLLHPDSRSSSINLYGDLLLPLAHSTEYEAYLHDESDGPATAEIRTAREIIWPALRGTQFTVERLQPAVFVHFGTTDEYWRMVAMDAELATLCGWTRHAASAQPEMKNALQDYLVLINTEYSPPQTAPIVHAPVEAVRPALISDSQVAGLTWKGRAIVAGVRTKRELALEADLIVHQLPVDGGFVTRILGMGDDPKQIYDSPAGTYLNKTWSEWFAQSSITPEALWSHVHEKDRNLWNARLFPFVADREESLELSLPLQDPSNAPEEWTDRWLKTMRISLAEGFAQADGLRILDDIAAIEDHVAVSIAFEAIRREESAAAVAAALGSGNIELAAKRSALLLPRLEMDETPLRWRGLSVLSTATRDSRYEDEAFSGLAKIIELDVADRSLLSGSSPFHTNATTSQSKTARRSSRVDAAARIDFGGGWTDTPPYSLERESFVLNAAVSLQGKLPITAKAEWLDESRIVLESRDIDERLIPTVAGDVLDYRNPADPFALVKAALVLKGIVPTGTPPDTKIESLLSDSQCGIRLSTQTSIPRGSGLGTSSIMAGAVLACLDDLAGQRPDTAHLFDQVLCVEQMMTTGGGWQDQVGGLVGSVKLVTSAPGLPQKLTVSQARHDSVCELSKRLFLLNTGQQRLAKNLLRAIMARWVARDPQTVQILKSLGDLALQMNEALYAGDLDAFGSLVADHWQQNKRMDPGCTNQFIDDLFANLEPFTVGAKLAGAGGGGFAILIARQGVEFDDIDRQIKQRYSDTPVAVWPADIVSEGLIYAK